MVLKLRLVLFIVTIELQYCSFCLNRHRNHSWDKSCSITPRAGQQRGRRLWMLWVTSIWMREKCRPVLISLWMLATPPGSVWQPVDTRCCYWMWAISASAIEDSASHCLQCLRRLWSISWINNEGFYSMYSGHLWNFVILIPNVIVVSALVSNFVNCCLFVKLPIMYFLLNFNIR